MPTNTPNLNLTTYDIATEGSVLFINAWENLIGTLSTSNMNKLDGFAGTTTATLQLLQDRPGSTHISATTADGVNYTATVSGLTSLSSGMIIYLEPDDVNTGNPYLNINSLGNKTMYKIDVDGVAIQLEPGDLIPTRKILLVYDGFSWYATGGINLSDYKISGAINSLIAIGSSNQPVASSIVLSGGKIGAESIKFDSTLNKDVNNNLMLGDSGITAGTYKGTTYDKYGRATASSGKVNGSSEVNIASGVTDNLVSINSTDGIVDAGYSASSFSLSTHNHSGTYLPIEGKAADSDKLDNIDSTGFVQTSGNQTVAGEKTFSSIPVLPATNPTTANQAVRKGYADATYLGITAKAADSDKLDGVDSTGFVKIGEIGTWQAWTPASTEGWTSPMTTAKGYYTIVGNTCYFSLFMDGTSNSANTYITLPASKTSINAGFSSFIWTSAGTGMNAGSSLTTPIRVDVLNNSTQMRVYKDMAGASWTASGQKIVIASGFFAFA